MQMKQFTGSSIDDVLAQVRADLGDGAVILQTRRVVRGGIGGFFGKEGIEVTAAEGLPEAEGAAANLEAAASVAAPPPEAPPSPPEPAPAATDAFERHLEGRLAAAREAEAHPAMAVEGPAASPAAAYARAAGAAPERPFAPGGEERSRAIANAARAAVRDAHLRAAEPFAFPALDDPAPAPPPPAAPRVRGADAVRAELERAGVDPRHLDPLMAGFAASAAPFLEPGADLREAVRAHLAARLPVAREWRPRRPGHAMAFVGQRGVGKSATVAKIAGRLRAAGRAVTVVAAGAGAHDGLAADLRRLDVHLVRAPDGGALAEIRPLLADRDVVLIDTPGCSHQRPEEIEALAALLGAGRPEEVHLVVPAATPLADLGDLPRRFRPAGVNRVTLTKLDETRFHGNLVNLPLRVGKPLAFVADGPDVPWAIAPADAGRIAELLLP